MIEQTNEIARLIESIWRPRVQADGGDIRFVALDDQVVTVDVFGECAGCPCTCRLTERLEQDLQRFGTGLRLQVRPQKAYFVI